MQLTDAQIKSWICQDEREADLMDTLSVVTAEAAAVMEKMADKWITHANALDPLTVDDAVSRENMKAHRKRLYACHDELLAAIPTNYANALRERIRRERLEEAEWWAENRMHMILPYVPEKVGPRGANRIAELRRAADVAGKEKSNA